MVDPVLFKATKTGKLLTIQWFHRDGVEWKKILDAVKILPGRTFDPVQKAWRCPATPDNLAALAALGFPEPVEVAPQDTSALDDDLFGPRPTKPKPKKEPELLPELTPWVAPWLSRKVDIGAAKYLRPYQVEAMQFLSHLGGRGLIGDDCGTGKTVMACGWAAMHPVSRPILIVCTQTTKLQWSAALMKFGVVCPALVTGFWGRQLATPLILHGQTPRAIPPGTEAIVINWDIVSYWEDVLADYGFKIMVADECQAMGNLKAKRTKTIMRLAAKIPQFIPMSGTPMRTRPAQFFPILHLLAPKVFPAEYKFLQRYCGPKMNRGRLEYKGSSNEIELHRKVREIMLRREVQDVLKDLPDKIINVVPVEADAGLMREYEAQESTFWGMDANSPDAMREMLNNLAGTAYRVKENACIAWVEDWLEENEGKKLLIFGWHRSVVNLLTQRLSGHNPAQIDGGITGEKREEQKHKFINDPRCRILCANILAAGVGLDGLQEAASTEVFVEFAPSPEDHKQAEARLYRSGQTRPVTVNYLIAPGTIDEDLMEVLDTRRKMLSNILDGKSTDLDFLGELLARRGKLKQ